MSSCCRNFPFCEHHYKEVRDAKEGFNHPLSIKQKRTMPVELVSREEYEEIKSFYKDVLDLLGSMNYNPDSENVNDMLKRAKEFIERHEY